MRTLQEILGVFVDYNGWGMRARSMALPPGAPTGRGYADATEAVLEMLEKILTSKTWLPQVVRLLSEELKLDGKCDIQLAYRFDGDTVIVEASNATGTMEATIDLKGNKK